MPVLTTWALLTLKKMVLLKLGKIAIGEALAPIVYKMIEDGLLEKAKAGGVAETRVLVKMYQNEIDAAYDGDHFAWLLDKAGDDYITAFKILWSVFT